MFVPFYLRYYKHMMDRDGIQIRIWCENTLMYIVNVHNTFEMGYLHQAMKKMKESHNNCMRKEKEKKSETKSNQI